MNSVLARHFRQAGAPKPDEILAAAAVARVERETRAKCADELRQAAKPVGDPSRGYWETVADRMENGE